MQEKSTPLLVVAAALLAADGRVLVQRRRASAEHGGLWEFPGGKVEAGESPATALVRELEEELGLAVSPAQLHPFAFSSDPAAPQPGRRSVVILLYTCRAWTGEPACRDGEEIAWVEPTAVGSLAMPPLDYPLAEALLHAMPDWSN